MTIIVAVKAKDGVHMGGDSAATSGSSQMVRTDQKVFKVGKFLIGFTDSFRMGQLLRYSLAVPEQEEGQNDHEYMVTVFVEAVRSCLKEGGYAKTESEQEEGGTFLVGYRGNIYYIESDYQVGTVAEPYASIGAGSDIALGALHVLCGDNTLGNTGWVETALSAACRYNATCRAPFKIISSK
jgi:ATP-dependent protease HslVU (ClpYQ) peptidase subunit